MSGTAGAQPQDKPTVALFATCILDLFRPSVGFAAAKLIRDAGFTVAVPPGQTCCGQPNFNGGDRRGTLRLARRAVEILAPYAYVVVPSGSCGSMIKTYYPRLFEPGSPDRARAEALAAKTYELVSFLHDVARVRPAGVKLEAVATYHDSCSGLRELGIKAQPRALLAAVEGLALKEMLDPEYCCGFGGTFCVKYPAISNKMVENKAADIAQTGAALVIAGDLGCLMNIEGKLHRQGSTVRAYHIAEVLAGEVRPGDLVRAVPSAGDGTCESEEASLA